MRPDAIGSYAERLRDALAGTGRAPSAVALSVRVNGVVSSADRDAYARAGIAHLLLGSPQADSVEALERHFAAAAALIERGGG